MQDKLEKQEGNGSTTAMPDKTGLRTSQRTVLRRTVARVQGYSAQTALLSPKSALDQASVNKNKPFTVEGSGDRKVLIPKSPNGKTLYFFFGYRGTKKDVSMRDQEAGDLEDDVLAAAAQGFKVVYDKAGTRDEFFEALYDGTCYGIYWSGHGYMNGNIQSSDGKVIRPEDVDVKRRSPKIRYLILAACGSGIGAQNMEGCPGTAVPVRGLGPDNHAGRGARFHLEDPACGLVVFSRWDEPRQGTGRLHPGRGECEVERMSGR